MGKIFVLAEKPSVARDIAKVLGCKTRKDGYIDGKQYVISWAVGHLVTLAEPEDYDKTFKKWHYNQLPIIPDKINIKPYSKTKKQLGIIKKLMNSSEVDAIICATDSGREGELIFRYIYDYAGCNKPFKRLWISSMTDIAITEGFENLKDGSEYDNLYYSAKCRSEADWLVGINATRAYTTANNVLLSIGRVQTPTLALIVDRQREIDDFKPQDYWEVLALFNEFSATWFDEKPSETKIFSEAKAEEIGAKIIDKDAVVEKVKKQKKKQPPPLLYDLTELQRDGNKKYGYTAKTVLSIAQGLYEKRKLITYPRTDSRYLSDDMIPKVKTTINKINVPPYNKAIEPILKKELKFTKRIVDNKKVTDHHAIIPTDVVPKLTSLSKDELNIYNLIVKRFISVFYDYYIYETTEIIFNIEDETFASSGKIIVQKGWKDLYTASKDDKEQIMPPLKKGDTIKVEGSDILKKQTTPPKPFTEGTLLSAMENAGRFIEDDELKEQLKESGFGTPATRAGIIERLLQVEYIKRKGKSLYPTEKGIKLIAIIPPELKSPETTGKWEKGLTSINKGKMESDRFMNSIKRFVVYLVGSANQTKGKVHFEQKPMPKNSKTKKIKGFGQCPLCKKGQVLENTKAYYCSEWRSSCKFTIWKNELERYGKSLDKEMIENLLKDNKIDAFQIVLPQTGEKCTSTLTIDDKGSLKLLNVQRI